MEIIEFIALGLLALGCIGLGLIVKINRSAILRYAATLINSAEQTIQGSGMGSEKKKLVIAQLQAAGIRVTDWLDWMIDEIVYKLNATGAWLATQAKQHAAGLQEKENSNDEAVQ